METDRIRFSYRASDDDPSGIATYYQAGEAYGLSTLWTSIVAFPLMASIQQMCAKIRLVTSQGLTGILKNIIQSQFCVSCYYLVFWQLL